jgi:hypothetical protein
MLFQFSLTDPRIEEPIDEGRKRIDIRYRNVARDGFFHWIAIHNRFGGTPYVMSECKNYTGDVANPELDQLTGRFAPWRGRVGLLLCRHLKDRALFVARCRDAAMANRGWVIVLDDDDLSELALMGVDPRWQAGQSQYLAAKMDELTR